MNFVALKKNLEDSFQKILDLTHDGQMPDEKLASHFSRLCTQLHMQAKESWVGEAEDFAHLANQLLQTVKKKKLEDSIRLVNSLQDAQDYCHRTFKS
ncbi:hypothetical protein JCM15519_23920 [Fundidesulfovibrio butyratiphilus]